VSFRRASPAAYFASLGRLMLRETVDVFFQVSFFDGEGTA
jgi:hypothetical protein